MVCGVEDFLPEIMEEGRAVLLRDAKTGENMLYEK